MLENCVCFRASNVPCNPVFRDIIGKRLRHGPLLGLEGCGWNEMLVCLGTSTQPFLVVALERTQ